MWDAGVKEIGGIRQEFFLSEAGGNNFFTPSARDPHSIKIHINFYKTGYNHAGKNKDNGNS